MKHILITTIAAVLLVGCGNSQADFALSQAVFKRDIAAAKQAIDDGADVDGKDRNRSTHLLLAASKGDKEIAELLIANGANVNAKNDFGKTPLDRAIIRIPHTEIVDLLRKHGGKTGAELKAEGK